jgi:hypothetical protein
MTERMRLPEGPKNSMTRVQIDLPIERVQVLDQLALEAGGLTRKDLFNNALTLLKWAVKEVKRGRTIASVAHDKPMTELSMPFLDSLGKNNPDSDVVA